MTVRHRYTDRYTPWVTAGTGRALVAKPATGSRLSPSGCTADFAHTARAGPVVHVSGSHGSFRVSRGGPNGDYKRLTESGIYHAVRDAAARSDLDRKRVRPHLLRASAITRMCAKGMHPAVVSQVTRVSVQVKAAMRALERP